MHTENEFHWVLQHGGSQLQGKCAGKAKIHCTLVFKVKEQQQIGFHIGDYYRKPVPPIEPG